MLPLLRDQIKSSVVDPRKFKSDEEYLYAQKTAWAYGQYASDLLDTVDRMIEEANQLTKKEQGETSDVLREALS